MSEGDPNRKTNSIQDYATVRLQSAERERIMRLFAKTTLNN